MEKAHELRAPGRSREPHGRSVGEDPRSLVHADRIGGSSPNARSARPTSRGVPVAAKSSVCGGCAALAKFALLRVQLRTQVPAASGDQDRPMLRDKGWVLRPSAADSFPLILLQHEDLLIGQSRMLRRGDARLACRHAG